MAKEKESGRMSFMDERASKYEPEKFDMKSFLTALELNKPEDADEVLVETAGFEPLDVKLYKMHQAGIVAQFNVGELTSQDLRDIYLNPDFSIDEDDDFEDVAEKLRAQDEFMRERKLQREREAFPEKFEEMEQKASSQQKNSTSETGDKEVETEKQA